MGSGERLAGCQCRDKTARRGVFLRDDLVLGGSGVVISGVTSPLSKVISIVTLLITLHIATHEPPNTHT